MGAGSQLHCSISLWFFEQKVCMTVLQREHPYFSLDYTPRQWNDHICLQERSYQVLLCAAKGNFFVVLETNRHHINLI